MYLKSKINRYETKIKAKAFVEDEATFRKTLKDIYYASILVDWERVADLCGASLESWAQIEDLHTDRKKREDVQKDLLKQIDDVRVRVQEELDELNFKVEGHWKRYPSGFKFKTSSFLYVLSNTHKGWSGYRIRIDKGMERLYTRKMYSNHIEAAKELVNDNPDLVELRGIDKADVTR